jgi:hypothetical protein
MTLLKARRFWQTRRRYAELVLVCLCALTFAAGCNGGKATGASTPAPAASPAVNASNDQSATTPTAATSQPQVEQPKPVEKPKKPFTEMTAMEVAQSGPASYGFKKGGSMVTSPVNGSDLEPSRDDQWIKETKDGKVYILTIHYDKSGKMVYAKWGGF